MFPNEAVQLTQQALWLVLCLSAPPVLAAALVGLLIAVVQAAMQLQEQTIQYAARFAVISVVLLMSGSLLGASLLGFCDRIFTGFAGLLLP